MKDSLKGKDDASEQEGKNAVMKWLKEQSTEYYKARSMLSFKGERYLLKITVTIMRSDPHRTRLSRCMIYVFSLVIIPL